MIALLYTKVNWSIIKLIIDMSKEFYTPIEIAEKLRVNVMTIYRYVRDGKIKAYRLGKDLRIDVKEYERFLKSIQTK